MEQRGECVLPAHFVNDGHAIALRTGKGRRYHIFRSAEGMIEGLNQWSAWISPTCTVMIHFPKKVWSARGSRSRVQALRVTAEPQGVHAGAIREYAKASEDENPCQARGLVLWCFPFSYVAGYFSHFSSVFIRESQTKTRHQKSKTEGAPFRGLVGHLPPKIQRQTRLFISLCPCLHQSPSVHHSAKKNSLYLRNFLSTVIGNPFRKSLGTIFPCYKNGLTMNSAG